MLAQPLHVDIQDRDWLLMTGLFESRVMTLEHVSVLYFEGRFEAAKKRLQKLKAAGFIAERTRRVNEPSILSLTSSALHALKERGVLAHYPPVPISTLLRRSQVSEITLRHELDVMDVKAAFFAAERTQGKFRVETFTTWPLLSQFTARASKGAEVVVKPDGFIRLRVQESDGGESELSFFLEVDRSSEMLDVLVERAICYLDYYRSGGFAVREGATREAFKVYPFRVLFVFKTAERRNNVIEQLLGFVPSNSGRLCFSTFAEVTANPMAPVWVRLKEYADGMTGTPFDPTRPRSRFGYSRRPERERLVETSVNRISLLD